MYEETTIAAIATSPGEGRIGIIRISGMQAADVADRVFHTKKIKSFHEAEPYRMYFGRVMEGDRQVDEGLAVYMRSPHSYTGEDVVEIQIHGSMEALRQTLSLVLEKGAVPAHRGEFTKRAFLNGRLDLSQAEAVMDIIEAKGAAALSQAESHLSGSLSSFVRASRDQLKDLIAKLEVTIDYPEEDLEDLTNEEIEEGLSAIDSSLRTLLSRSEEGRIIRDGLRTAISVGQTGGRLVARLRQFLFDALIGSGQFGLGTVGSGEAIGDFLGSFIQRLCDRRPHEFHREPHKDQKDNGLNEQGRIDTHGNTFLEWR